MKIYTKTGDTGDTSLFGGARVKKNCIEIDAIGDVDELNGAIGVLIAALFGESVSIAGRDIQDHLKAVQHRLFTVGSLLASVQMDVRGELPQLHDADIQELEAWIDSMESHLSPLTQFILPGGTLPAAQSFWARAVCRRAERRVVDLSQKYPHLDPLIQTYLNRLSDALFVLGRWLNKMGGAAEVTWRKPD